MNFWQCVNLGVNELRPDRSAHQDAGQIRRQNKSLKGHKSRCHMQSLSPGEGKCIRIKFYRHFLGHHQRHEEHLITSHQTNGGSFRGTS